MALTLPDPLYTALLLTVLLAPPVAAWGLQAGTRSHTDSENIISTLETTAGMNGLEAGGGNLDLLAIHNLYGIEDTRYGLEGFSDQAYGFLGTYSALFGQYGLVARTGLSSLEGWMDYSVGGSVSRYWVPADGLVLRAKGYGDGKVNKENPIMASLAMRTLTSGTSLNLTSGPWYLEAGAEARHLDGASNDRVDALLQDTTEVGEIPRNRILSGYLYAYRTNWKVLTLGAFASWADSRSDYYRYLHRNPGPPSRLEYMSFPYDTPLDSYAFGGLVALDVNLEDAAIPLGRWSFKTTFPFHSRRKQYWEARSNLGAPMPWSGYYTFRGDGIWSSELKVRKALPGEMGLTLAYNFFLKPYLEYGYLDRQSYRIHALEFRISRG